MKKSLIYLSVFTLALILTYAAANWSTSQAETKGRTLWGTWYVTFIGGFGVNIPAVVNINRDGTFVSSDGSDFGGPPFPVQQSPLRGVWGKTGANTFEGKGILFNGDAMTGELLNIMVSKLTIEFGDDFDHISGTLYRDIFDCPSPFDCPDPLSAEPDRTNPPVLFHGNRLRLEP